MIGPMTDYTADLDRGLKHLTKTRPEYVRRQAYQDGTVSEAFGSKAVRKALRLSLGKFRLNFAAQPADALIRRVKIAGCTVAGGGTLGAVLDDIIAANELEEDFDIWFKDAAVLGDYYVLATEGDEDGDVDIVGRSPLSTAILYRTDNTRKVAFGLSTWPKGDRVRVNLYYDDETYQMISKVGTKGGKSEDFVPLAEVDTDPESDTFGDTLDPAIVNEWGFPLFHLRTDGKPYGVPVHGNAFGAQDAITKLVATHMGSVDALGFPLRYALSKLGSDTDDAGEDFGDGETVQDGPTNGSKLDGGPGEMLMLTGVDSVGQFDPADSKNFLDPIVFYIRAMAKTTSTPLHDFDLGGVEPSGEARRRAEGPINDHAESLKRGFGVTVVGLLEYALRVLGHDGADVDVAWKPAEIITDKEGWETFALKVRNGVPLRQALLEVGYSKEQIEEWHPEADPALSLDAALALSEALASFGQAAAAGMVGPADVGALFSAYLVGPRPEVVEILAPIADPLA